MNQEELLLRHEALGYGRTAQELLETCQMFAEMEAVWLPKDLYVFKGRAGINEKVWKKLLTINEDKRLQSNVDVLPTNYNALFSLTRYSDEELKKALEQGLITPKTSYRTIDNWRKKYAESNDSLLYSEIVALPDVEIKVIYHQENAAAREIRSSLLQLSEQYPTLKIINTLPRGTTSKPVLQGAKTSPQIAEQLEKAIDERDLEFLVEAALLDLQLLGLARKPGSLKNLSLKNFKELLVKIIGSAELFWKRCGEIYQYRVALEIAKSEDYTTRNKLFSQLVSNAGRYNLREVTDVIIELLENQVSVQVPLFLK
jgi:hypothetical protein